MNFGKNYKIYSSILFGCSTITFYLIYVLQDSSKVFDISFLERLNVLFKYDNETNVIYFENGHKQFFINGNVYPKYVSFFKNKSLNFEYIKKLSTNTKTILYWNGFFSSLEFGFGLGKIDPFTANNCPIVNCETTTDKSRLSESDLVLVHLRNPIDPIPSYRPAKQRWVAVIYESPVHCPNYTYLDGVFNLTSTYRIDSDFSYEGFTNIDWHEEIIPNNSIRSNITQKINFAVAVISNCGAKIRNEFINELKKYIQVDIYGACGTPCPQDCKKSLAERYLFYFAFENSICEDYITEKFFDIIHYDIVPVVLGGGNYEYYVPKSAYIDTRDFDTAKSLAEYLIKVSKDNELYNSFFEWKKYLSTGNVRNLATICDMCIQLHLEQAQGFIKTKVINNLGDLWNRQKRCKSNIKIN